MRLVEEKQSVTIQLVILLSIVLTGIGIQICDTKVADHHKQIQMDLLHTNRIQSEKINQNLSSVRYLIGADANIIIDEQ